MGLEAVVQNAQVNDILDTDNSSPKGSRNYHLEWKTISFTSPTKLNFKFLNISTSYTMSIPF